MKLWPSADVGSAKWMAEHQRANKALLAKLEARVAELEREVRVLRA